MYCATVRTAGQVGCVEGMRGNPPPLTFSILSHSILADRAIAKSGKLILLALLKFARQKAECFPALGTLARAAGVSESTARRHLARLVEAGLLSIRPTKSNPTGRTIVLDFARDPDRHPAPHVVRVSNRQGALGSQSAPPVRVPDGKPALGFQTAARVSPVDQKRENNPGSVPSIQRQRSEASAMHLDMIGAVDRAQPGPIKPAGPQPEPITLERARTIMAFVAKGGPLRDAVLRHLTSDVLAFMDAQGGELAAFAAKLGGVQVTTMTPKPAAADESRVLAVVETAKAITPGSHPRLVDRFADRMVSLLGDPGSRAFYCKVGHQLRGGSFGVPRFEAAIRDAMASDSANRAAIFVGRLKGN